MTALLDIAKEKTANGMVVVRNELKACVLIKNGKCNGCGPGNKNDESAVHV